MGLRRFDRKFGRDLLRELPEAPAVYLFKDDAGAVLYVGKAKNVRRRLAQYRNATRRKAHRKMRELVRVAATLEIRPVESETAALLFENELIREHRPEYNVDGAYAFLYPAIGTAVDVERFFLCFASQTEAFDGLELRWHGCFRPRWRAREAFEALVSLVGRIGHPEPRSRWPAGVPALRGTRFVALRRFDETWAEPIRAFLDGESDALLGRLFDALLERSSARQDRAEVQAAFDTLAEFYAEDARRLREARLRVGWAGAFVGRDDRDGLFIRARGGAEPAAASGACGVSKRFEPGARPTIS